MLVRPALRKRKRRELRGMAVTSSKEYCRQRHKKDAQYHAKESGTSPTGEEGMSQMVGRSGREMVQQYFL